MGELDVSLVKSKIVSPERLMSSVFCANINSYLLLTEHSRVFVVDAAGEKSPVGPIQLLDNSAQPLKGPVSLHFDHEHDTLVLRNEQGVGLRRDVHGIFFLRTALNTKPTEGEDGQVSVELSAFEAAKLLEYATSLQSDGNAELDSLCEQLKSQIHTETEPPKWSTAVVRGKLESLSSLFAGLLSDLRQQAPSQVLPVVAALIERLNMLKSQPYNFELGIDGNGLDKAVMASEAARRTTFEHWPHMHYKWALPNHMAQAGFYHQPNSTGDDRVMCFTCSVCLVCWEPSDEPWSEHERHSPQCPFTRGDCTHNVPLAITYGSLPAVEHELGDAQVCVGTVSNCDWLPTASLGGHIQLWHLDRVHQTPQNFQIDMNDPYIGMKTGYMHEQRRPQRVTWSDDACEPVVLPPDQESSSLIEKIQFGDFVSPDESAQSGIVIADLPSQDESGQSASEIGEEPSNVLTAEDMVVSAVCSCSRPVVKQNLLENDVNLDVPSVCSSALVVGMALNDDRLRAPTVAWIGPSEVDALNSVNRAPAVRIETDARTTRLRPFLLVYKIDQNSSKSGDSLKAQNRAGNKKGRDSQDIKNQLLGQNMASFASSAIEETQSLSDIEEELLAFPPDDDAWTEENNNAADLQAVGSTLLSQVPVAAPPDFSGFGAGSKAAALGQQQHDLLQLQCEPLVASLLVLQCFRLPQTLDCPGMVVKMLLPSTDGLSLVVVVNNENKSEDSLSCAIVVYKLSFTGLMTGLQEGPLREYYMNEWRSAIQDVVLLPPELGGREPSGNEKLDMAAVVLKNGRMIVLDLDTGGTLFASPSANYVRVMRGNGNNFGTVTDDGQLQIFQMTASSQQSDNSFESNLLPLVRNPSDAQKIFDSEVFVSPISTELLGQFWELTRSDSTAPGSSFSAVATSSCWNEVQQHQRLRKNPQHYLREEKLTRSWHLVPDGTSWKDHVFEIMVPNSLRASHIDVRFVLHSACIGLPDIEVTLLRKGSRSSDQEADVKEPSIRDALASAEVVSGPLRIMDAVDLTDNSGLLQLSSPLLQSAQYRNYFIHIKAVTEESESQKLWKMSQEKTKDVGSENANKKSKLPSQPRAGVTFPKFQGPAGGFGKQPPLPPTAKVTQVEHKNIEDRKGCDLIEEITITIWKTKRTAVPQEKLQRLQLLYSTKFHSELVKILSRTDESKTAAEIFYCQNLALDILLWMADHNVESLLLNVRQSILDNLDSLLTNCFVNSTRSVAHKCCALLCQMFCYIRVHNPELYSDFVERLASSLSGTLALLPAFQSAGSLTWLLCLTGRLFRIDPLNCQQLHSDCLNTLMRLGHELSDRTNSHHYKLLRRLGLSGAPMELEMFDWPQQVLSLMPRGTQQFSYANAAAAGVASVTGQFLGEITQDELDWGEFLNVDVSESSPGLLGSRKQRKRWYLSREHLYGLLEVEPLAFSCQSASDGLRVENLESGISTQIGGSSICSSLGPGPIPLPDVAHADGMSGNPAIAHAVSSMNQQVQSILSKQMQLLALQQQRQKLQGHIQEHSVTVEASVTPATQGSSASTFGVPTTPKTTPFMTPTPLSPSQLSPINSETDLPQFVSERTDSNQDVLQTERKVGVSLMPQDMLKPPPCQALHVDRMNSGMRKFVVLDFGRPVFLTDLVIPSCGDLGSLCIDVWIRGESVDGQRLLVSNDISHKTLAVSDLQPPAFCRYLKITYIGRHGMGSCSCKIPLGSFYGYRFIAPWQLHMWAGHLAALERMDAEQLPVSVRSLRQLAEDLRCRHHLAANQLLNLLDDANTDEQAARDLYKDCAQMRLQWNLVRRVVARMEWHRRALSQTALSSSWTNCSMDQLRNTAHQLLACLVRSAPVFYTEPICAESMSYFLEFDSALALFQQFCASGMPLLQAFCSIFLFQHGCSTSWWGEFFAVLLRKFFGCGAKPDERLFLLVSYLCDQSVKAGSTSVITQLLKLVDEIADRHQNKTVDGSLLSWALMLLSSCFDVASGRKRTDRWSFLTGEFGPASQSSLDSDRNGSRQTTRKSLSSRSKPAAKVKWLETGVDLMEQQYQKTLLLYEDIKHYVGGSNPKSSSSKISKKESSSKTAKQSSSRKRHSRSRTSSRSLRLKLSPDLCLSVVNKLVAYLTECGDISYPANLIACKVVSRTCASSAAHISLLQMADRTRLKQLLSLALDCRQSSWMRHAVLCLLLDMLDLEQRAQRSAASKLAGSSGLGAAAAEPTETDEWPDTTAVAQGTLLNPDTPKEAQQAIDNALATVTPIEIPGCPIENELRTKYLKALCKEVIHSHLNSGEPLSRIEIWLGSVKQTEKGLASTSQTAQQYKSRVQKFLSLQSGGNNQYIMDLLHDSLSSPSAGSPGPWSSSAFGSWGFAVPPLTSYSMPPPPPPLSVPVMSSSTPVATMAGIGRGRGKPFSVPENPGPGYAAAKEKLSKLCEQIQMSNSPIGSMSTFMAGSTPPPMVTQTFVVDLPPDSLPIGDEASGSADSGVSQAPTEADESISSSITDLSNASFAEAPESQRELRIDIDIRRNVGVMQPVSACSDERAETQVGCRAMHECQRWLLGDDTLLRMALRSCVSLKRPANEPPPETVYNQTAFLGNALGELCSVISDLFTQLTSATSCEYVERLMMLFSEISLCVSRHKKLPTSVSALLSYSAICSLTDFFLTAPHISEHAWILAFRVLQHVTDAKEEKVSQLSMFLSDDRFESLLQRFLLESSSRFGGGLMTGPVLVNAFGDFLNRLHHRSEAELKTQLCYTVCTLMVSVLGKCAEHGQDAFPLDVLIKMLDALRNWWPDYRRLPSESISSFIRVSCRLARVFLTSETVSGKQVVSSGATSPALCFQQSLTAVEPPHPDKENSPKTSAQRQETLVCGLLTESCRFVDCTIADETTYADCLVLKEPVAVQNLLSALAVCETTIGDVNSVPDWSPQTVGDWVAQLLSTISVHAQTQLDSFFEIVVKYLSECSTGARNALSMPLVCILAKVLCSEARLSIFGRLGGFRVVAEQLLSAISVMSVECDSAHSKVLRRLACVANQVMGVDSGDTSSRRPPDAKIEGLTNFAPTCQIQSSSPMAHHLNSLLASTPPHRRARTAAWSYHFYPAEIWLDMTLTLPYPVLLHEIQIRPHAPTLNTGPGAVQVELGCDASSSALTILGSPLFTTGYSRIRIPTTSFSYPVQVVKLHLKRPPDSSNLGLSQVLLLGTSPTTKIAAKTNQRPDFVHWLNLLSHLLTFDECSLQEQRTHLSQLLSALFVQQSLDASTYETVSRVLQLLSCDNVADSLALILQQLTRASDVREQSLPWLAELVFLLCTKKQIDATKPVEELVQFASRVADGRSSGAPVVADTVATYCFWLTACILWTDCGSVLTETPEHFTRCLYKIASGVQCGRELRQSAAWLLCSLCRRSTATMSVVLSLCPVGSPDFVVWTTSSVLAQAAMSRPAAQQLLNNGLLAKLATQLSEASTQLMVNSDRALEVLSLTQFFAQLSQLELVKRWLSTKEGGVFIAPLLQAVSSRRTARNSSFNWATLERSAVELIQRCLWCNPSHQERFSQILCHILRDCESGLSSALQEIVLCTLLEDERVPLLIENDSSDAFNSNVSFTHPCFGCSRKRVVQCWSVFAECQELLSPSSSDSKMEKKVSYAPELASGVVSTGSMYESMYANLVGANAQTASAFSDMFPAPLQSGLLAAEKAKAKRSLSKSAGRQSSEVTAKESVPLKIFCKDIDGSSSLRSELTVGQLYLKAMACCPDRDGLAFLNIKMSPDTTAPQLAESEWPSPVSVLELFAKKGGLALLAQHLQLYQPSYAIQPKRRTSYYCDKDLQYMDQLDNGGFGTLVSSHTSTFGASAALAAQDYDYDFEFIDVPGGPHWGGGNLTSALPAQSAGRMLSVTSSSLSPHVVVSFSVFLRLNGYAELLVSQDRHRAQRLLRLAMGVTTDSSDKARASDSDSLSLLSFSVLDQLYQTNPVAQECGRLLRRASFDLGIVDILLVCLASFSHHSARATSLRESCAPEPVLLVEQLLQAFNQTELTAAEGSISAPINRQMSERQQFWAKGTGFGTGSTQQQWNVDLHMLKRKHDEETVTCLLKVLASFVFPEDANDDGKSVDVSCTDECFPATCVSIIKRSCLIETLASYLRNDSVLDISRHVTLYESVLQMVSSLAKCPSTSTLLLETDSQNQSLRSIALKYKDCIQVYMSKLSKEHNQVETLSSETQTSESQPSANQLTEEGLVKLVPLVESTAKAIADNIALETVEAAERLADCSLRAAAQLNAEGRYMALMNPLQYVSTPFFDSSGALVIPYHYESSVLAAKDTGTARMPRTRRLAQEAVTLSSSLPLSASSSVFVRAAEERLDVMKVLMTGPADTPYANGCFEFDVWFPTDYPNSPMHINLQTTGGHTIRFNPNLYNDGKVCLSVLNTWHGRPEERWSPQASSFLQVIVSIQSLILVSEPYFNEPGYERSRGTPAGQQASREYDANIQQATVRWAMLEMLRKPPTVFKDAILGHFWLKRDEICRQIETWIAELEKMSDEQRSTRNMSNHLTAMKRHYQALKEELQKMQCPSGFEEEQTKPNESDTQQSQEPE